MSCLSNVDSAFDTASDISWDSFPDDLPPSMDLIR
ncbi:Protein CBG27915 [Caenorhabditis briggsae]|uniref:Protein CBG27915 n=1 Tax=Caenorhabditis briggsae TaxID=6238 RepID=B6IEL0_CAEBR|nr:Protein CBG27915 [Caenorhabditis briggsae]CAR98340.1 Protein CBG27915 [Caenorhabditis briggsae]